MSFSFPCSQQVSKSVPPQLAFSSVQYFIMKSSNVRNIEISQQKGIWSTTPSNETKLTKAFLENNLIILVFSVQGSGHFQVTHRFSNNCTILHVIYDHNLYQMGQSLWQCNIKKDVKKKIYFVFHRVMLAWHQSSVRRAARTGDSWDWEGFSVWSGSTRRVFPSRWPNTSSIHGTTTRRSRSAGTDRWEDSWVCYISVELWMFGVFFTLTFSLPICMVFWWPMLSTQCTGTNGWKVHSNTAVILRNVKRYRFLRNSSVSGAA